MARIHDDLSESSHHSSPSSSTSCESSPSKYVRSTDQSPNIAIIGAGIAGLRCADILIQRGAQVTIYEAQDKIGGRTRQTSLDGRLLDMGANFIHGSDDNPIADIARRTSTAIYPLTGTVIIDSEGNSLDPILTEALTSALWELEVKAFQHSDENFDEIDESLSLLDYLKEQIPIIEPDRKKQALLLDLACSWGGYTGEPINKQSLKFMFLEECIGGETTFVADSYAKILAEIAAPALAKATVHFNEEVTLIDTHTGAPSYKSETGVTIHTRSGIAKTYDEVVLTAPLGWLKQHKHDAFSVSSPLPADMIHSIENISFSRLEKVYLTFEQAWWEDTPTPFNPFPTPYAATTHFLNPSYAPHPHHIPWNQTMLNLAALPPTSPSQSRTPTLLFYLYGECSAHLLSLLPSTPNTLTPTNPLFPLILSIFAPFLRLLPHFSPTVSTPLSILSTAHSTSPFSHGSYTHLSPGTGANLDADIATLRKGTGRDSGLWLAGEHTAPFIALGTTTGAYWSGEGVARRVLGEYGMGGEEK